MKTHVVLDLSCCQMESVNNVKTTSDLMVNITVFQKHVLRDKGSLYRQHVLIVIHGNEDSGLIRNVALIDVLAMKL